jgi:peptide/nickel transport system ATP-binding protein
MVADPVLTISNLKLGFRRGRSVSEVLHGISLHVRRGEKVALVGESGSGKSVTARLVMGLLQATRGAGVSGRILFEKRDVTRGGREVARLRGERISMIFQDPTSALNPVFRIGQVFAEVLHVGNSSLGPVESRRLAAAALAEVSIPDPARCLAAYPFQLSGGMNQRVLIAMALINRPTLLIADEPGTALDVTVQAQTLRLMDEMTQKTGTAVLFISHNLGVVREFADRVYVIYRGNIVEHGTAAQIFADPRHPYTRALLQAVPKIIGGGLPELPEQSPRFLEPLVVHSGCGEPEALAA